jgi:hypothetical protein
LIRKMWSVGAVARRLQIVLQPVADRVEDDAGHCRRSPRRSPFSSGHFQPVAVLQEDVGGDPSI